MPSRFTHYRKPKPPPIPDGFNSLDVHITALKRPCSRCGGKMYRDEWGDERHGPVTKLHSCAECGFERPARAARLSEGTTNG